MSVRVRPFADRDYTALARIWRVCEGERVDAAELRARDARWDWSRYERVRVVAVDEEDAPIAYAELYHEPSRFDPRRYFIRLAVDPPRRRRGVGAALWEQLRAELEERGALVACLWARDHTACVDFITARGFREVARSYLMIRAVETAPRTTEARRDALAAAGVRIASLAELARDDPAAPERAHEAYFATRLDEPTLGRVTPTPFASWRADAVDGPAALPDAYFVAVAEDRYVGQCTGRRTASDDVLEIGVTGVLPDYRRRGIGRGLKHRLHSYAAAHAYREIHTRVGSANAPMVRLNESLGYVIVESLGAYELATPSSP